MPRAKPIAQHIADGTFRADRHGRRAAVEVGGRDGAQLKPPATLRKELRPLWRKVIVTLDPAWLATADVWLLAGLVEALHFQQEASEKLITIGTVIKTVNGDVHKSPYWMIWRQAVEVVRTLSGKLGLSPLDRARLAALVGADEEDTGAGAALEEYIRQRLAAAERQGPVMGEEW